MRIQYFAFFLLAVLPSALLACDMPYPPSMVKALTWECSKGNDQMTNLCSCVVSNVQKSIPLNEFIEIGNGAGGINGDSRFIKINKTCTTQFPLAQATSAQATANSAKNP